MAKSHPKVALSGSRTFTDQRLVERVIDRLIDRRAVIHIACSDRGCTAGVDTFVHQYVDYRIDDVYDNEVFYAEWRRYGKRAGFLRNEDMIRASSELIAFLSPGAPTPGTSHAIGLAQRKGIPLHVYQDGKWTSLQSINPVPESLKPKYPSWVSSSPPWLKEFLVGECGYELFSTGEKP